MAGKSSNQSGWQGLDVFSCNRCSLKTSDLGLFQAHHCKPRNAVVVRFDAATRKFTCSVCRVELPEDEFKGHLASHNSPKPFLCVYCEGKFESRNAMYEHLRFTHTHCEPSYRLLLANRVSEMLQSIKSNGGEVLIHVDHRVPNISANPINSRFTYGQSGNASSLHPVPRLPQNKSPQMPSVNMVQTSSPVFVSQTVPVSQTKVPQSQVIGMRQTAPLDPAQVVPRLPFVHLRLPTSRGPAVGEDPKRPFRRSPLIPQTVAISNEVNIQKTNSITDDRSNLNHASTENYSSGNGNSLNSDSSHNSAEFQVTVNTLISNECNQHMETTSYSAAHVALDRVTGTIIKSENSESVNVDRPLEICVKSVVSLHASPENVKSSVSADSEPLASAQNETSKSEDFSYLRIIKGLTLCLKCLTKWQSEFDLFFKHIWKNHAHESDFSCCPMGYSTNCSRLAAIINTVCERSPEPLSDQIRSYFLSVSADKSGAIGLSSSSESAQQSATVSCDSLTTRTTPMNPASDSCNPHQIIQTQSSVCFKETNCEVITALSQKEQRSTDSSFALESEQSYSAAMAVDGVNSLQEELACTVNRQMPTESVTVATGAEEILNLQLQKPEENNITGIQDSTSAPKNRSQEKRNTTVSGYEDISDDESGRISSKGPMLCVSRNTSYSHAGSLDFEEMPLDLSQKTPPLDLSIRSQKSGRADSEVLMLSHSANETNGVCSMKEVSSSTKSEQTSRNEDNSLQFFYKCGFHSCIFMSPKSSTLHTHLQQIHNCELEFPCVYCSFFSGSSDHLIHHMEGHIGNKEGKTFSCSVLENSESIIRFDHNDIKFILRNLETIANSNSAATFHFACNTCRSVFVHLGELEEHLQKSLLKVIECKYCESRFLNVFSWQKHMTMDHAGLSHMYEVCIKLVCCTLKRNKNVNASGTEGECLRQHSYTEKETAGTEGECLRQHSYTEKETAGTEGECLRQHSYTEKETAGTEGECLRQHSYTEKETAGTEGECLRQHSYTEKKIEGTEGECLRQHSYTEKKIEGTEGECLRQHSYTEKETAGTEGECLRQHSYTEKETAPEMPTAIAREVSFSPLVTANIVSDTVSEILESNSQLTNISNESVMLTQVQPRTEEVHDTPVSSNDLYQNMMHQGASALHEARKQMPFNDSSGKLCQNDLSVELSGEDDAVDHAESVIQAQNAERSSVKSLSVSSHENAVSLREIVADVSSFTTDEPDKTGSSELVSCESNSVISAIAESQDRDGKEVSFHDHRNDLETSDKNPDNSLLHPGQIMYDNNNLPNNNLSNDNHINNSYVPDQANSAVTGIDECSLTTNSQSALATPTDTNLTTDSSKLMTGNRLLISGHSELGQCEAHNVKVGDRSVVLDSSDNHSVTCGSFRHQESEHLGQIASLAENGVESPSVGISFSVTNCATESEQDNCQMTEPASSDNHHLRDTALTRANHSLGDDNEFVNNTGDEMVSKVESETHISQAAEVSSDMENPAGLEEDMGMCQTNLESPNVNIEEGIDQSHASHDRHQSPDTNRLYVNELNGHLEANHANWNSLAMSQQTDTGNNVEAAGASSIHGMDAEKNRENRKQELSKVIIDESSCPMRNTGLHSDNGTLSSSTQELQLDVCFRYQPPSGNEMDLEGNKHSKNLEGDTLLQHSKTSISITDSVMKKKSEVRSKRQSKDSQDSEVRSKKKAEVNQDSEIKSKRKLVISQDSEIRSKRNSEDSQNSEIRSKRNSEDSQNSEIRSKRNSEDSQNSEIRSKRNSEDSQNSEIGSKTNSKDSQNSEIKSKRNSEDSQNSESKRNSEDSQNSEIRSKRNSEDSQNSEIKSKRNSEGSQNSEIRSKRNSEDSQDSEIINKKKSEDSQSSEIRSKRKSEDSQDSEIRSKRNSEDSQDSEIRSKMKSEDSQDSEIRSKKKSEGSQDSEIRSKKSEGSQGSEIRSKKKSEGSQDSEIRSKKKSEGSQDSETESKRKSEDSQNSEIRSKKKSEDSQNSEIRSKRKLEDSQNSEIESKRNSEGSQKSEISSKRNSEGKQGNEVRRSETSTPDKKVKFSTHEESFKSLHGEEKTKMTIDGVKLKVTGQSTSAVKRKSEAAVVSVIKKQKSNSVVQSFAEMHDAEKRKPNEDSAPCFKCSICTSFTSYSYKKIRQHLKSEHPNDKSAKAYKIASSAQSHSPGSRAKLERHGVYRCVHSECDFTSSWNTDIMKQHINSKHPYYSCGYCNAPYVFIDQLKNHLKFVHRGMEPRINDGTIALEILFKSIGDCNIPSPEDNEQNTRSPSLIRSKRNGERLPKLKGMKCDNKDDSKLKTKERDGSPDLTQTHDQQTEQHVSHEKLDEITGKMYEYHEGNLSQLPQAGALLPVKKQKSGGVFEEFLLEKTSVYSHQDKPTDQTTILSSSTVSSSANNISYKRDRNLFEGNAFVDNSYLGRGAPQLSTSTTVMVSRTSHKKSPSPDSEKKAKALLAALSMADKMPLRKAGQCKKVQPHSRPREVSKDLSEDEKCGNTECSGKMSPEKDISHDVLNNSVGSSSLRHYPHYLKEKNISTTQRNKLFTPKQAHETNDSKFCSLEEKKSSKTGKEQPAGVITTKNSAYPDKLQKLDRAHSDAIETNISFDTPSNSLKTNILKVMAPKSTLKIQNELNCGTWTTRQLEIKTASEGIQNRDFEPEDMRSYVKEGTTNEGLTSEAAEHCGKHYDVRKRVPANAAQKYKNKTGRDEYPFKCILCTRGFTCQYDIEEHIRECHPAKDGIHDAKLGLKFSAAGKVLNGEDDRKTRTDQHLLTHSPRRSEKSYKMSSVTTREFTSGVTTSKTKAASGSTLLHTTTSSTSLRYHCSHCNDVLSSEFLYRLHLAKHPSFKYTTLLKPGAVFVYLGYGYVAKNSSDLAKCDGKRMTERFKCALCEHDDHTKQGMQNHMKSAHSVDDLDVIDQKKEQSLSDLRPRLVEIDPKVFLTDLFKLHPGELSQLVRAHDIHMIDLPDRSICEDVIVQNCGEYFDVIECK